MIRVLLADDQSLVRGALAALLSLEPDIEVVAEVGRGDEVVAAARRTAPEVALLDVEMPGLDGIAAAAALRAELPGGAGGDPHHLRPAWLPAPGDGGRRARLRGQGRAGRRARRRGPPGRGRRAGGRPGAGRRHAGRRRQPADRPGAGRAAWPPGTARPSPTSPAGCSCPRARSATTCPRRSPRPAPATGSRPSGPPRPTAGCELAPSREQRPGRGGCPVGLAAPLLRVGEQRRSGGAVSGWAGCVSASCRGAEA